MQLTRRGLFGSLGVLGAGASLGACSGPPDPKKAKSDPDTLLVRLWDQDVADALTKAVRSFTRDTGWKVAFDVRAWDDYWTSLPLDVASEDAADVFWMNAANLAQLQVAGSLLDLDEAGVSGGDAWQSEVTDLYRREDTLWGVPITWETTHLLCNDDLLKTAKVDPDKLAFDPSATTDPLRKAATLLTRDGNDKHPGQKGFDPATRVSYGFGAVPDRVSVLGPFIAANGGAWQNEDESFAFASPEGVAALEYLAEMAGTWSLAPAGEDSVASPTLAREWFSEGRLALVQVATHELATVAARAEKDLSWSVHPALPGPKGSAPLVHGVAAVGNAASAEKKPDKGDRPLKRGITELLTWLGSAEAQEPLGTSGLGIPAHRDAQDAFRSHWKKHDVDLGTSLDVPDRTARPETGVRSAEGTAAALPILQKPFLGTMDAADAAPKAQKAADEEMNG